jgi:hypothetical protein
MSGSEAEAIRQQTLLRALWGQEGGGGGPSAAALLQGSPARIERGLQAYRVNAAGLAARALAAAYPTIAQLLGDEPMSALARALWRARPPVRGDIGQWGEALPEFIAACPDLAGEPYLPDVARLDWAVHAAESAADAPPSADGVPPGLVRLGHADPAALRLQLAPGAAVVASAHPAVTIWLAHRSDAEDRLEPARAALARGQGEYGFVWRAGWRAQVAPIGAPAVAFVGAVLRAASLEAALAAAGAGFDFEAWLIEALRRGWLAAVATLAVEGARDRPPAGAPREGLPT